MANLFTFFDNGTWEAAPPTAANQNLPSFSGNPMPPFTLSSDFSHAGTKSGKIQAIGTTTQISALAYLCGDINHNFLGRGIAFTVGTKYIIKCKIYTPSAQPIGTDTMPIILGPDTFNHPATDSFGFITVADCKDTWKEVTFQFTMAAPPSSSYAGLYIYAFPGAGTILGFARSGTLLGGGKLYVDDITVDQVLPCTIGYDNPAFNSTNCTSIADNDGSITVHAYGTGTLQYRLGAGAWQLSNVFTGLTPGTYYIDIKDTTSCTVATVPVTILAYMAPPPPVGGELIFNEKPLNNYNFVPWFEATTGDTGFASVDCVGQHWDLPKPYDEIRQKKVHAFVIEQGEDFTFYANFDTPLPTSLDFTKLRLGLARNSGMVNMNLASLQKDANSDGTYNVYATASISTAVPAGDQYFMVIYRSDDFSILYVSGRMEIMAEDDADTFTCRLQYRHSNLFYNYHFDRLPSLLLQIRMRMANVEEQTEAAIQQYRAVSNGQLRNVSFDLDKSIKLETYYYDVHGIRGMYSFQAMETIIINDKNYVLKTAYKTSWSGKGLNVHKGSIELFEQEFSTQNKYGNPSTIIIVGSDDSLLQADNGHLIKV